jgi:UDPglucose 6-dehydrogenase
MKIAMIGVGHVGLVSGACFSNFGHEVFCVDILKATIDSLNAGNMPFFEPDLAEMVAANVNAHRLSFTLDLKDAVSKADVVFITVSTPNRPSDGRVDLRAFSRAARDIAAALTGNTVVITKSTVPVGTWKKLEQIIRRKHRGANFDVASNPEFLREGSAVWDFCNPDRVVVGVANRRTRQVVEELYEPLLRKGVKIFFTSRETAEVIKYASNAFLATKITFINEMANFCEYVGADVKDVAYGMGLDHRIGDKFLHAGPGYGGSCFPKDTQALVNSAKSAKAPPLHIVKTVVDVNRSRKRSMARKVEIEFGGAKGKTIGVLGLTFKPKTNDMRDAPSLIILPLLKKRGATLRAYDPKGMQGAKEVLDQNGKKLLDFEMCDDAYEAVRGADGVVILTEWEEFGKLDLSRLKSLLKRPLMVDLHNMYRREDMAEAGFTYISIGRPRVD